MGHHSWSVRLLSLSHTTTPDQHQITTNNRKRFFQSTLHITTLVLTTTILDNEDN